MISTHHLDRPKPKEIVRATVDALRDAERAREAAIVRQVIELQANESRVAVGLDKVLGALAHGRVHRLLLAHSFDDPGFRCQACGKLGRTPPVSCELCGEPVVSCDLGEAMVRIAMQRGGEVDEIVDRPEFMELGGVAALLRY